MNSKSIGDKAENEVVKILERDGFLVQKAWRKMIRINGRWISKTNDFFGCFDIIALPNKVSDFYETFLIQVTTENELGKKRAKIKKLFEKSNTDCLYLMIQIWCRIKEKNKVKYRVYNYPKFLKKDSYVVDK